MRVIIAGGSGLIGRALANRMSVAGNEVIILSRSPRHVAGVADTVRTVQWDARTAENWGHLIDSTSAVVNLAGANIGEGRWTAQRKKAIVESRLSAAAAIVQAVEAAESKPSVVVQGSAVGYYGDRGDEILTETAAPAENYFASQVCVQLERAIEAISDQTRVVIVRTGIVLSSRGGALPKLLTPFKMFTGGPFGHGKQWFSWIHILDEVEAIAFLIATREARGAFNLTAPNIVTNGEFAKALGAELHRPSLMPAPAPVLRLALGEMAALLLDGQRAVSQKLQGAGFRFSYDKVGPALRDIIGNKR